MDINTNARKEMVRDDTHQGMNAQKNRRKLVEVLLMVLPSVSRRQEKTGNEDS